MNCTVPKPSLRSLLGSLSVEEFFAQYWGKRYLISSGLGDRFSTLFSWEALSEILSTHRFEYPRIRLLNGGRVVPPHQFMEHKTDRRGNQYAMQNASAVKRLLESGAALHITAIGEAWSVLAGYVTKLEYDLAGRVQVNLHAGYSGARGFHTHWDGHDVYAAQIDGEKRWRIFGFTDRSPLAVPPDEKGTGPNNPIWEGTLGLGQMLYLPRGYWHATEYVDAPSLHLTFAVQHPMGLDFLNWLIARMKTEEIFRVDIPRFDAIGAPGGDADGEQYFSAARDTLIRAFSPESLKRYLAEYRSSLGASNLIQLNPRERS